MIRRPTTHPRNRRRVAASQPAQPSFLTPQSVASSTDALTITTDAPFVLGSETTMIVKDSGSVVLALVSADATDPTTLVTVWSASIDKTKKLQILPQDPIARSTSSGYLLPGIYTIS